MPVDKVPSKKKRSILSPVVQVPNKRPRLILPPPPPYKIVDSKVVPNKAPKIQKVLSELWSSIESSEEDSIVEVSSVDEIEDDDRPHISYSSEEDEQSNCSVSFYEADDEIV